MFLNKKIRKIHRKKLKKIQCTHGGGSYFCPLAMSIAMRENLLKLAFTPIRSISQQ